MYKFASAALIAMTALGCSSSNSEPNIAAFQVSYESPNAVYYLGVPIVPNAPSLVGESRSFSISPPLPIGLQFDVKTGMITGEPEGIAPTRRYTITSLADNAVATTDVNIGIVWPPRFAFVANEQDSTISSYSIDPRNGELQHNGYTAAPGIDEGPADMLLHPSGEFFFAVNHESRTITVYSLDFLSGAITPISTSGDGSSPNEIVQDPAGRFLYVTSLFTSQLLTYEFDREAGTLTDLAAPVPTQPAVADLAMHPSGRFLSMTNRLDGLIETYSIDPMSGLPSLTNSTPINSKATALTYSNDGDYLFVTAEDFHLLVRFRVDQQTGELSQPRTRQTGDSPQFVEAHPSGRFVYVVNSGSNTVTKYTIDEQNGIPMFPTIVAAGFSPQSISFDPGGNYAYVTNSASSDLSVYRVDLDDGSLKIEEPMRARSQPRAMIMIQGPEPVTNEAQFVYVVNEESGDVASYVANASTGRLSEIGTAPLAGDTPVGLATDPLGRFIYVANQGSSNISCFKLDPLTGSLTEVGMPTASGLGTNGLTIDASGRFLFAIASGSNTVTAYRLNATTGELTEFQTELLALENPISIEVDPTGRFLYIVNGRVESDPESVGGITVFSIQPRLGTLRLEAESEVAGGGSPSRITFSRSGRIAYVPLGSDEGIVAATVNASTGTLAGNIPSAALQLETLAIAVSPSGRFAYSAVRDTVTETMRIDLSELGSEGGITPISTTIEGSSPTDLVVDPSGAYLYAVNRESNDISLFEIEPDSGELSLISRTLTGLTPVSLGIVSVFK